MLLMPYLLHLTALTPSFGLGTGNACSPTLYADKIPAFRLCVDESRHQSLPLPSRITKLLQEQELLRLDTEK